MTNESIRSGASAEAVRAHYDVGNDFYQLWLDEGMTYSCALWNGASDTLEQAQARKLDHHIDAARARGAANVLDIGCGWGSMLTRLTRGANVERVVGLTLSDAQAEMISARGEPGVEVRVESWADHAPTKPYDAIISIGAFEHFAKPETTVQDRIDIYRTFFERCRAMVKPGGWLSLQTIAFGIGRFVPNTPLASVFPESCLPRLGEITTAADGIFEVQELYQHRDHYARTLAHWEERLRKNTERAVALVGKDCVDTYFQYLDFTRKGFEHSIFVLYRLSLQALPPSKKR